MRGSSRVSSGQRDFRLWSNCGPVRCLSQSCDAASGARFKGSGTDGRLVHCVVSPIDLRQAPEHWVFEGTNMKKGDRVAQLVGGNIMDLALGSIPTSRAPRKVRSTVTAARSGAPGPTLTRCTRAAQGQTCVRFRPVVEFLLSTPPGFPEPPLKASSPRRSHHASRRIFRPMKKKRMIKYRSREPDGQRDGSNETRGCGVLPSSLVVS